MSNVMKERKFHTESRQTYQHVRTQEYYSNEPSLSNFWRTSSDSQMTREASS